MVHNLLFGLFSFGGLFQEPSHVIEVGLNGKLRVRLDLFVQLVLGPKDELVDLIEVAFKDVIELDWVEMLAVLVAKRDCVLIVLVLKRVSTLLDALVVLFGLEERKLFKKSLVWRVLSVFVAGEKELPIDPADHN